MDWREALFDPRHADEVCQCEKECPCEKDDAVECLLCDQDDCRLCDKPYLGRS